MQGFISYWYFKSFARFYASCMDAIEVLDGSLAVRQTIKNIRQPLFQDYTWDGRLVGLLMRLGRILVGLLAYFFIAVAHLVFYVIWLIFPAFCLISLVGSLLGGHS